MHAIVFSPATVAEKLPGAVEIIKVGHALLVEMKASRVNSYMSGRLRW